MSSKALLVAGVLTPSIIFSVMLNVGQVRILPNRPAITYIFGKYILTDAQIEQIRLDLQGNDVVTVTLTYYIPTWGRYCRQVALYDVSGNLISSGTGVCLREQGFRTQRIDVVPDVPVDNVATVKTCIAPSLPCL